MTVLALLAFFGADETAGGFTQVLSDINLPAVTLVATSGVLALFYILNQMKKYQQEITDKYIAENNKLRAEILELKTENNAKDDKIDQLRRDIINMERDHQRQLSDHDDTIRDMKRTIRHLERGQGIEPTH